MFFGGSRCALQDKIEAQGDSFYDELHEYQDAMWEFSQKCRKRLGSTECVYGGGVGWVGRGGCDLSASLRLAA